MKTPLDNLMAGGKHLLAKVRLHYQQDPTTLPPDQQVTVAQLDAWYRGVETALEKAFGTDSHELRTWHFRKEQIKEQEWENITRRTGPIVVSRLENTLGILEELKVATTEALDSGSGPERDSIADLLKREEGAQLEFKAALRWDNAKAMAEPWLEYRVLCTIAAFANAAGGTLLIGISPQKNVLGIKNDCDSIKGTADEFERHLRQLASECCGEVYSLKNLQVAFEQNGQHQICRVTVKPAAEPIFLGYTKLKRQDEFWVRAGNANKQLAGKAITDYAQSHFGK